MAEITAAMVKALRERTGLPMMDCKSALTETNGDPEAAIELLRKRGAAAAEKKAGRETAEGRIGAHVEKGKGAALAEILCETAPTGNNPEFKALCAKVAKHVALGGNADAEAVLNEKSVDEPAKTVQEVLHDTINKIRENMKISRLVFVKGHAATYIHHTGKVGVIVGFESGEGKAELINDVCMHIAAMQPAALKREDMPAAAVKKEEEIAREQILASGKPANLVDKILTGKMGRWFSERVLLEQPFVKDDKQTVGKVLESAGVKLLCYARLQVGEV